MNAFVFFTRDNVVVLKETVDSNDNVIDDNFKIITIAITVTQEMRRLSLLCPMLVIY